MYPLRHFVLDRCTAFCDRIVIFPAPRFKCAVQFFGDSLPPAILPHHDPLNNLHVFIGSVPLGLEVPDNFPFFIVDDPKEPGRVREPIGKHMWMVVSVEFPYPFFGPSELSHLLQSKCEEMIQIIYVPLVGCSGLRAMGVYGHGLVENN